MFLELLLGPFFGRLIRLNSSESGVLASSTSPNFFTSRGLSVMIVSILDCMIEHLRNAIYISHYEEE